jgi:hypothetical protein
MLTGLMLLVGLRSALAYQHPHAASIAPDGYTMASAEFKEHRGAAAEQGESVGRFTRQRRSCADLMYDSVLITFACRTWGCIQPPLDLLMTGKRHVVDTQLGPALSVMKKKGNVWDVLGEGIFVEDYTGTERGAEFYRDPSGVRLIALEGPHFASDTIILSRQSTHAAKLVASDLGRLRTESGIGLGDTERRVRGILGQPSRTDEFGDYCILWYLGQVRRRGEARYGLAAAYVLKGGAVVEVWLHVWSPDRSG